MGTGVSGMSRPQVAVRTLVVEAGEGGALLAMDDAGVVREFLSAEAVVAWVKSRDKRDPAAKVAMLATRIEWRSMPAGFMPPQPA